MHVASKNCLWSMRNGMFTLLLVPSSHSTMPEVINASGLQLEYLKRIVFTLCKSYFWRSPTSPTICRAPLAKIYYVLHRVSEMWEGTSDCRFCSRIWLDPCIFPERAYSESDWADHVASLGLCDHVVGNYIELLSGMVL